MEPQKCGHMISVIVPIYNAQKYLAVMIESLRHQSYAKWELILVDNGSRDGSVEICTMYENRDRRICVVQERKKGVSAARNSGLKMARGEYILFVDADDFLPDSNVLERLVTTIQLTKADIVVGNYEGTVRTIELLYTKLTTVDNKVVMLPNGTLSNSNIINVGAEDYRRLDIEMSIGYSSDLKLAKTLLNNIINANPAIIKDREIKVIVKSLDESCVTLETRAWVKTEDYWDTKFTLLENYKSEFDKNGIEIPFNQMDVHIIQ